VGNAGIQWFLFVFPGKFRHRTLGVVLGAVANSNGQSAFNKRLSDFVESSDRSDGVRVRAAETFGKQSRRYFLPELEILVHFFHELQGGKVLFAVGEAFSAGLNHVREYGSVVGSRGENCDTVLPKDLTVDDGKAAAIIFLVEEDLAVRRGSGASRFDLGGFPLCLVFQIVDLSRGPWGQGQSVGTAFLVGKVFHRL
jgi:hypothetical protein